MNEILSQLREGEDFEYLMSLHNDDTAINGVSLCFTQGYMPENTIRLQFPSYWWHQRCYNDKQRSVHNQQAALDNIYLIENYGPIRQECAKYSFDSLLEDWKDKLRLSSHPFTSTSMFRPYIRVCPNKSPSREITLAGDWFKRTVRVKTALTG